jgi:hypothetical protein
MEREECSRRPQTAAANSGTLPAAMEEAADTAAHGLGCLVNNNNNVVDMWVVSGGLAMMKIRRVKR